MAKSPTEQALMRYPESRGEIVRRRIELLRSSGFSETGIGSLLKRNPNLHSETLIRGKIEFLSSLGFGKATEMLVKLPSLIGYSPESIRCKFNLLIRLIQCFDLEISPFEFIEKYPNYFCQSFDKIKLVARLIVLCATSKSEITRQKLSTIFSYSIEDLIMGSVGAESQGLGTFTKGANTSKKSDSSLHKKRRSILQLPPSDVRRKKYLRIQKKKDAKEYGLPFAS